MNRKTFFIVGFFFCIAALFARGNKEPSPAIVQLTGTVRLVGSSLFSEVVISTDKGEWYIAADEKEKLFDLQHRTVTVEGEETVTELKFAGGMSAGIRRELRNIVIVRSEE